MGLRTIAPNAWSGVNPAVVNRTAPPTFAAVRHVRLPMFALSRALPMCRCADGPSAADEVWREFLTHAFALSRKRFANGRTGGRAAAFNRTGPAGRASS